MFDDRHSFGEVGGGHVRQTLTAIHYSAATTPKFQTALMARLDEAVKSLLQRGGAPLPLKPGGIDEKKAIY